MHPYRCHTHARLARLPAAPEAERAGRRVPGQRLGRRLPARRRSGGVVTGAVAICGWLLAVLAAVTMLSDRRRSAARAEAAARACHELRGPLTCVRLGLELVAREKRLSVARLRALELGLSQAALALDDLEACSGDRE